DPAGGPGAVRRRLRGDRVRVVRRGEQGLRAMPDAVPPLRWSRRDRPDRVRRGDDDHGPAQDGGETTRRAPRGVALIGAGCGRGGKASGDRRAHGRRRGSPLSRCGGGPPFRGNAERNVSVAAASPDRTAGGTGSLVAKTRTRYRPVTRV